jgi:hypothetical protein
MPISTAWSSALCSTSFFFATSFFLLIVFMHVVNTEGINVDYSKNSHLDFSFKVCCGYTAKAKSLGKSPPLDWVERRYQTNGLILPSGFRSFSKSQFITV